MALAFLLEPTRPMTLFINQRSLFLLALPHSPTNYSTWLLQQQLAHFDLHHRSPSPPFTLQLHHCSTSVASYLKSPDPVLPPALRYTTTLVLYSLLLATCCCSRSASVRVSHSASLCFLLNCFLIVSLYLFYQYVCLCFLFVFCSTSFRILFLTQIYPICTFRSVFLGF